MSGSIGRRDFLKATGGALLGSSLLGLTGCGGGDSGGPAKLRVSWYGGKPVHDGLNGALDLYKSDAAKIKTEFSAFPDYWDKLATQTAGGKAPDVMRMSMSYFAEYVERGALLDLSDYVGEQIKVSDLDKPVVDSGKVDGKFRGIGQSSISHAMFVNKTMLDKLKVPVPEHDWTWDGLADFAEKVTKAASKKDVYGTTDRGGNFQIFEVFVRQHGTEMFDGQQLALGKDVLKEWLTYWQDLRKAKLAVPSQITAEAVGFEKSPLVTGMTPVEFGWVQQIGFYQPLTKDELVVNMVPSGSAGSSPGQFLKALDFWVCSSRTENPEEAAKVVNFLLNDREATRKIGLNLGVPPSDQARKDAAGDPASPAAKAIEYVEFVADKVTESKEVWPKGYGELLGLLDRVNQEVGFGKASIDDGVDQFFSEAKRALSS
ncbi:MAG: extracellular solute-binding protein [Micromonosporaceae bacterium]